ncbi:MAG: efflux RND transporter periplasmic adaptor subunit [Melioribacteraceae bacterium]|nr:efflux RND transporter periplasmic adaptor subunit [Melioribacteraceae bacterium]MCF8356253.1 efflux RND transporter periplasmic adaptor subunit [Melioribacteraceae bacterium]MCF8395427.1 efflux RND transporter periplasmic adaptor subunit [Melioribacteraceae bacterium]MCF8420761.1 efflux RND transporter periplasmic adaptor subunit [Melioribacteraceae bacterium]
MIRFIFISIIISALALFTGCSHEHESESEEHGHEHGGAVSVTQYTDSTEIFMEYPALVINQNAEFLIHLTDLKDFKAVTEGVLIAKFKNSNGTEVTVTEEKPARDGIYIPTVSFPEAGNYTMTINLHGEQVSDVIVVDDVKVYASEAELPHVDEEESSGISFLKEQQWKIDFANEPVTKRKMQKSVLATGEIEAKPENYSKVTSPIAGTVLNKNNTSVKSIGDYVKEGEVLLNISPSADAGANIQKIKNDYLLAKSEYERVQNLYEKNAVPQKRLNEAKFEYESKKASYNSLSDQIKITETGYSVIAPISGYVEKINFNLGENLNAGQELYTIINPNRLILKANVPAAQIEAAVNSNDASFQIEGFNSSYEISDLNGRKISVAAGLNETNRTIPVYYEFNNPQNKIKIGMFAEVYVKVGEAAVTLAIPESAIVNEDGLHTAYVQTEGESFEKRILKTGIIDDEYVEIIHGLKSGERVVTEGAYQVRLASLSPESAIGHGHAH